MRRFSLFLGVLLAAAFTSAVRPAVSAQLTLLLPLNRTAYQTNEIIDLSVVRADTQPLAAGNLVLTVTGDDASAMHFTFPVKAVGVVGNDARTTEHLHLNGWLLRPEGYTLQVDSDGATAQTTIQLFSHIRKTTYRNVHWWGPTGKDLAPEGENGLGFNLILGGTDEPSIRGGEDVMGLMVMGGAHQFDMKLTNDWSDPYVYIGANQRAADRVFGFRTMPNAIGAHLYDEPGLTWLPAPPPHTEDGPWDIAPQRRAYESAFGKEQMWHDEVKPDDPASLAQWKQVTDFRLGFMDAFWKSSYQMLQRMKPGFLAATQSQYAWWALYDGYYFNVARSLPIISGHGGYDDGLLRNFYPSYNLEMSLPRQMDKPNWFLPEWGVTSPQQLREEHYLSFMTGIQGMSAPPYQNDMNVNGIGAPAAAEFNREFGHLGTIFTKPAYTRQAVAILYPKSEVLDALEVKWPLITAMARAYMALKMDQYPTTIVLEEDIRDGTLAANHKAVILTGIHYLEPTVKDGLEAYMKTGGAVLMTDDCAVDLPGAVKLGVSFIDYSAQDNALIMKEPDLKKQQTVRAHLGGMPMIIQRTEPLAKALKTQLQKLRISPAFESSAQGIAPGRQVRGDIEYLFAVNYTTTDEVFGTPEPITSTITLPNDGRPVYDAMHGGLVPMLKKNVDLSAVLRFGPGQMRVFARTARPIGGVSVAVPVITRDYTLDTNPLTLDLSATLIDTNNQVIAGTAPMEITVTDPLGDVRYDIYRAAEQGTCRVSLPLAANDAFGAWTVTVKELLNNSVGKATFTYQPAVECGAVAGQTRRAVFYPCDKDNIYRLFRDQRSWTIVAGGSDYDTAAANRLADILKPYNVTCTIVRAKDANKVRTLTDEAAATWCGTSVSGSLKPEQRNDPRLVGFALPGPSILVGNPKDNPLIQDLATTGQAGKGVLPYRITDDFPGRGHGYIAWNTETLGHDLETVACIGSDADGINEAVGTLFELAVGLDPLTPLTLPVADAVTPAAKSTTPPAASVAWQTAMPDRVISLTPEGANITALSWDGTQSIFDATGKMVSTKVNVTVPTIETKLNVKIPAADMPVKVVPTLPKDKLLADLAIKQILAGPQDTAVSYWGGTLQIFGADGAVKTQQMLPQDISSMAWQGANLVTGLADGSVMSLTDK